MANERGDLPETRETEETDSDAKTQILPDQRQRAGRRTASSRTVSKMSRAKSKVSFSRVYSEMIAWETDQEPQHSGGLPPWLPPLRSHHRGP
jgi:hypothetical protein